MMNTNFILVIIIFFLCVFVWFRLRKNFKVLNTPSFCLTTGGIKTGKSKLSVWLSQKDFKSIHRKWFISKLFCKLFRKKFETEEPLYYTNCLTSFSNIKSYDDEDSGRKIFKHRHHRLDRCIRAVTKESLMRNERLAYKSVVYINEASLLADNMDINNIDRNVELSLYAKLFAHSSRGGKIYVDTQSVLDVHYSFKRVCSTYFFIQKRVDFFLFDILYVREMINTENGVNNFDDDVDFTTRKVLVPRWYNKHYDRYEFSYLTDELPVSNQKFIPKRGLVSFNPRYIAKGDKRKKKEVSD